ncbi:MAG: DUF1015 domain-containing protein [Caldimicrobium sp.]|nr:DUF1015 domain-containing protein [Caldimicrobium sp.]MCX7614104.1 DUF1015 domain-containing protein [Caldimicrobium sp.]MDW8182997.1 DUF1015 domain-containing protein [Caldimicrobium sp.]
MPECRPFQGYLYNLGKVSIHEVLAPPYDVVTPEEIRSYKNKSPFNIFHLELSESAEKAKTTLEEFLRQGILIQNSKPAIYYHEIAFSYEGKSYIRRGFILLVRLHEFDEGIILPHERVFKKVTEERLNLLKTTHFQFSQIHSLYEDDNLHTFRLMSPIGEFIFEVSLEGVTQRLAKIQDPGTIEKITTYLKHEKLYIADGHHRYNTALQYRAYMRNLLPSQDDHDFDYIAMYISPVEDENLLMLPTHRLYTFVPIDLFLEKIKAKVNLIQKASWVEVHDLLKSIENRGNYFILVHGKELFLFEFKKTFLEPLTKSEQDLTLLPLYNFIKLLETTFDLNEEILKERGEVCFISRIDEAIDRSQDKAFGVLFPRVSPQILKRIVSKGKLMPHKSTYFYPKILTGMVISEVSGKILK